MMIEKIKKWLVFFEKIGLKIIELTKIFFLPQTTDGLDRLMNIFFLRKKSSLIKNGQMFFLLGTHLIPDLLTRLFDNVVVVVCVTHTLDDDNC